MTINQENNRNYRRIFFIENNIKSNNKYISNGIIETIKIRKKQIYKPLKYNFIIPNNNYINIELKKIKYIITLCFCRITFLLGFIINYQN
jgi:hypothetical protein